MKFTEPRSGLPPHVALLLNEEFELGDFRLVARKLRQMAPDLKRQVEASPNESALDLSGESSRFKVVLSGGLDLFGRNGSCQAVSCRIHYALRLSRSIALTADEIVLHDFFGERILALRSRPTNVELDRLVADLHVLKVLQPLIQAGVVRFISPYVASCSSCMGKFEGQVELHVQRLVDDLSAQTRIERTADTVSLESEGVYRPPIHVRFDHQFAKGKADLELLNMVVRTAVRDALWSARDASLMGAAVFSNSAAGMSALLAEVGSCHATQRTRILSDDRAAELPWVDGLSVDQILQLREEASEALPSLREFLAQRLGARPSGNSEDWEKCVAELREQAQRVRSELQALCAKSPSLRRNAFGVLGLAVSAVCFASEGAAASLGTLLGTLSLLHDGAPENAHQIREARASPGFVLVAAERILAHAES